MIAPSLKQKPEEKAITSGDFKRVDFSIDEQDSWIIFDFLSNRLYSDKILACIREYYTNAADEHVKHGVTRPVEITLPTQFEPHFKVRDFAKGLNEEQMETIFTKYGKSTKRDSNESIGCLGLGCKSAFAYTSSWNVVSIIEEGGQRKKLSFVLSMRGDKVPQLELLGSCETDEETGLEISIPVQLNHITPFHLRTRDFFKFFKVLPIINNSNQATPPIKKIQGGNGWAIIEGEMNYKAIMGGISYPIDKNQFNLRNNERWFRDGLILEFEIGELEFNISREALEYTNHTKRNILRKLAQLKRDVSAEVEEAIEGASNFWEAYLKFRGLSIFPIKKEGISWRGIPLKNFVLVEKDEKVYIESFRNVYGRKTPKNDVSIRGIEIRRKSHLFYRDTDKRVPGRARAFLEEEGNENSVVYLLSGPDLNDFLKRTGLVGMTIRNISSIEPVKIQRNSSGGCKTRQHVKLFKYRRYGSTKSDCWEDVVEEVDGGIYAPIKRFSPVVGRGKFNSNHSLGELQDILKFLDEEITIYGVREADVPELGPNWQRIDDFWNEKKVEFEQKHKSLKKLRKYIKVEDELLFRGGFDNIGTFKGCENPTFRRYAYFCDWFFKSRRFYRSIVSHSLIKELFPVGNLPADLARIKSQILEDHPFLQKMSGYYYYTKNFSDSSGVFKGPLLDELIFYVNCKYRQKKS